MNVAVPTAAEGPPGRGHSPSRADDAPMRCNLLLLALVMLCLLVCVRASEAVAEGSTSVTRAEFAVPPAITPGDKLPAIVTRNHEYFARRGSGRGTGYRQYSRGLEFAAPRLYPAGD